MQNLHLTFGWHYIGQKEGGDFTKFCGQLRNMNFNKKRENIVKTNFNITNYFLKSDLPKIQTCVIIHLKKLFHFVGWKYRIRAKSSD